MVGLATVAVRRCRLSPLTKGGPSRGPEVFKSDLRRPRGWAFARDGLSDPAKSPGRAAPFSGNRLSPGGKGLVVCDWGRRVGRVDGLAEPCTRPDWRRTVSAVPALGLKVHRRGESMSGARQIAISGDINGDGETDFVECFKHRPPGNGTISTIREDLQVDPSGISTMPKGRPAHGQTAVAPPTGRPYGWQGRA